MSVVRYGEPNPDWAEELEQKDVGGPPGYANFLAAIADPRHEEHRSYMEWSGGRFDSAGFEQAAVNRALAGLSASLMSFPANN